MNDLCESMNSLNFFSFCIFLSIICNNMLFVPGKGTSYGVKQLGDALT